VKKILINWFCFSFLILVSCETDIEKINIITKNVILPDISMENAELLYSDTAKLKVKIIAPKLDKYNKPIEPYMEFPIGVEVFFYNENEEISSTISAEYGIYYETKRLWEGRKNVIATNDKGEKLNTEQLFWDMEKEIIFSDKFSKITTDDGVFFGKNGFTAEQDFSRWRLKGSEGSVNIKEEQK
jgi:LPS export ABC transporter protein LptC